MTVAHTIQVHVIVSTDGQQNELSPVSSTCVTNIPWWRGWLFAFSFLSSQLLFFQVAANLKPTKLGKRLFIVFFGKHLFIVYFGKHLFMVLLFSWVCSISKICKIKIQQFTAMNYYEKIWTTAVPHIDTTPSACLKVFTKQVSSQRKYKNNE